jgi:aryl-alcohol dehydrogenase-like predicted oxidoreductase
LVELVAFRPDDLELGLGLVSIGRVWGVANTPVPDRHSVMDVLATAVDGGIRCFDTAPAYGASEQRLGVFLAGLSQAQRAKFVIMTKVGEHWDAAADAAFTDHGYDAMARSLDRSVELLGRIDVLQLHKATEDVIRAPETASFFRHARAMGISTLGASVSSVAAGKLALETGMFSCLQFPLNAETRQMESLLHPLQVAGGFPVINRPFAMGGAVHAAADKSAAGIAAFRFLRDRVSRGIVLTGTGKAAHLAENLVSYAASDR